MQYMGKTYAMIYGRRSVRRYESAVDMDALKDAVDTALDGAASMPGCTKPTAQLLDGASAQSVFTGIMGHYGKVVAPAYMVVSARPAEGYLTQAGYVVEQMVLYLACLGYGTCWIGIPIDTGRVCELCPPPAGEKYVILLAVGRPAGETSLLRSVEGYRRKPMEEMILGEINAGWEGILQAARFAPSASNGQPWLFACREQGIDVYCAPGRGPIKKKFYNHLNRIDCGITIAHLDLAARHAGYDTAIGNAPKEGKLLPIARLHLRNH